ERIPLLSGVRRTRGRRPHTGWRTALRSGTRGGFGVMTVDERVRPVMAFGFTERQARFLTTVMLHGGVCLQRHYCRSAGLVHGVKTRTFFHDLVAHGYATAYPCARNGAR